MPIRVPPAEVPIITWLSPNKGDQGLIEFWNTELASYIPLDVGAPHPNQRQYEGFTLGKQAPVQGDEKWTIRTWVSDETSPDWFNWAEKFSGEDNAFPIFIRTYREPRNTYTPREKGTPLGTLFKTVMTNTGSGYANGALPSVTFDDSVVEPTTVAIAHGVVSADGSITEVVLDNGGEGYEANLEFTVASPINGTPAEGIAYVQPQIAILVREEASLYPPDSEFYAGYVQVTRVYETIPGPPFYETSLDVDGEILTTTTTRKLCSDITTGEAIDTGIWCKTTKKPTDIDVICEEVIACRAIPGLPMDSTTIDDNGDILSQTKTMVESSTLVTTNVILADVWTKTFQQDIDGTSLVSWEVVQVRNTQNELNSYSVSIPDLIPPEFRGVQPIVETGETLIGQASLPTLGLGEIFHEQRELDAYTYRETIRGRPDLSLPITLTNQELTEEYGGGSLDVVMTLDLIGNLSLDEGLTVVASEIRNLGNGLGLLVTKQLQDPAWPVIHSRLWDDNMRVEYDETRQVVDDGTGEDPDPGGGVFGWVSEVKGIDKWRSQIINTSKPTPAYTDAASALISYEYKPYRFPGLLYVGNGGYYVRHADATLVQHKISTWWIKSATTPTVTETGGGGDVEIDEIIMDDVVINNLTLTGLTYSGPVLHDALVIGILSYPATTPSYTQYTLGTPTGTTLIDYATLYNPGSTGGYVVGDTITIAGGGFTMSVDVTFVYDVPSGPTGLIGATTVTDPSGTFPAGTYGPFAASGGSGSGAFFNVFGLESPTYTPGTQWIGTFRVVGAEVKPEREKDIWKIVTESVVMR